MAGSNASSKSTTRSLVGKSNGGRPTKFSPEVITKLKAAFANSFTVEQACWYAEIHKDTYYSWLENNERFSDEMEAARHAPTMKAKQVVIDAVNKGDVETAKWWLNKKAPEEFGSRPQELNLGVHFHQHSDTKKADYEF